ncbi:MAG: M20 family metallo-hydrolase [Lentilactobacillus diolivorans]|uniref:N-carbamoyl-L-amino-acid hydrolase n=2 Tax=Lentilactobacillus diolivorans TaxID=179838 RepID=A0A0R1SJD1_9LACO|nr:M20 family metallo-hydrolase [Lentilactobacillus diolivorans]KRL69335.1 N-carbamoyl-L-amino-acid hydrolase [Lentilactobacillus diolivorans DSM 14421]GEP24745.1 Zn-dependent hydrolase [Lentilactobacillus diolivorans]
MLTTSLDQLDQRLKTINSFSHNGLGQNRLVYTPSWIAGQKQLINWGLSIGLAPTVDDYGTVYLDVLGTETPNQIIATGSHMDTVAQGGRFDGLYGVIGGLQSIETLLNAFGRPKKTLRLISFSEEEGSRFPTTFSGSKHYARIEETVGLTDKSGISFDTARIRAVSRLEASSVNRSLPSLPLTFTELHIEQGPRLVAKHQQIGLVTSIVGQRRFTVVINGIANHAGTTPMNRRHDALQSGIQLISRLELLAQSLSPDLTVTVGEFNVEPNTSNVIPGKVSFTIDCRHVDSEILNEFETMIHCEAKLMTRPQLSIRVNRWANSQPVQLDQQLLAQNDHLANQLNLSHVSLASGAGHDSQIMSQVTRTTMIFVPSINGISHAPQEATHLTDLKAGVDLLTASLHQQAY